MAHIPNQCPRVDDRETLGKTSKRWKAGYIRNVYAKHYYDEDGNEVENAVNILTRDKQYKLGDISYCKYLPSNLYLECNSAGTTDDFIDEYDVPETAKETAFINKLKTAKENDMIADGTVVWHVKRVGGRADIIPSSSAMLTMAPQLYARSNPWTVQNGIDLISPLRLWVEINAAGLMLSAPQTLKLSEDSTWDYQAQMWAVDTSHVLGDIVYPTTRNGYYYKCILAGKTSATIEPTWVATSGAQISDGTCQWECVYDITQGAYRDGQTYYLYACIQSGTNVPKFLVSADSDYPKGYSANDARQIGSFKCATTADVTGGKASAIGDILDYSIKDIYGNSFSPAEVAEMAMASNVYENITHINSTTTTWAETKYTAKAAGYIYYSSGTKQNLTILALIVCENASDTYDNRVFGGICTAQSENRDISALISIRKGQTCLIRNIYASSANNVCRFIYSVGSAKELGLI